MYYWALLEFEETNAELEFLIFVALDSQNGKCNFDTVGPDPELLGG